MTRSEQKAATRAKILELASKRLRTEGLAGNGVQRLMRDCGLTHGGFTVHFANKQALDIAALEAAMAEQAALEAALPGDLPLAERRKARARAYLSRQHRDHPETGCPLAALLSDAPRAGEALREAYQGLLAEVVTAGDASPARVPQELALTALAMGGLALARAVPDPALSDAILSACRAAAATLADAYDQTGGA